MLGALTDEVAAGRGTPALEPIETPKAARPRNSLDERVSELADVYAFLSDRLGFDYHPAADRHRTQG